jgi:hypothetical protein
MIHNLSRPVVADAIQFSTDKDTAGEAPYALKPVFNRNIKEYTVYVHEAAEKIIPTGYPEAGASVTFHPGYYGDGAGLRLKGEDGVELPPVPFEDGAYAFPAAFSEMLIEFSVYKEFREETGYKVLVTRRFTPGTLMDLKVTIGYWSPGVRNRGSGAWANAAAILADHGTDLRLDDYVYNTDTDTYWVSDGSVWTNSGKGNNLSANPEDPFWRYETDNYMVNFDAAGTDYPIEIPYYAQKVLIAPDASSDVVVSYTLYPRNPQYYPDEKYFIGYNESVNPQKFFFTNTPPPPP